jgi:arylsulfatase A-like enzyme
MPQRTPNIVLILTDDLGYGDCSCYGQKTWTTPNIDQMAGEGMRFTDFYTTSPVCSPARTSILTGLHSGRMPIRKLPDPYLPDDVPTVPKVLNAAGYVSACIGKYGVGNGQPDVDALRKGFDYHYGYNCMKHAHNYFPPFLRENGTRVPLRNKPPDGDTLQWETGVGVAAVKRDYSPDFIEARALEFIERNADRPFFLAYCPTMPHANNEGGESPDGMEVDTYGEFERNDWKPNEKGFARMVQRIDVTVGRIRDTLRGLDIEKDTVVVFTSDNGPHNEGGHAVTRFDSAGGFQGYKRSLHEGGIRIPFIVAQPGTVPHGVSKYQGYFPDLFPTFCAAGGAEAPAGLDGISCLPVLTGDEEHQRRHEYLYFEYCEQRAVREGPWKFYQDTDGDEFLFKLDEDYHEDRDVKRQHPDVFSRLRGFADREHIDYVPAPCPVSYSP